MKFSAYRALLRLYPRRVREEYGPDMLRLYRDQLRQLRRDGRPIHGFALRSLLDLFVHACAERLKPGNPLSRWRFWMHAFLRDVRYGARLMLRTPGTTFLAVLTLALGIGANAAIFSLLDAVLLRPLPYHQPDDIVTLWEKRPAESVLTNVVAPADFRDWAARQTSFTNIAAAAETGVDLIEGGEPQRVPVLAVSPAFFDVLGIPPALGRAFRADEAEMGKHRVVVLTDALWRTRFGRDSTLVGRTLNLSGLPHEVIGVLPASFEFPEEAELFVPLPLPGEQSRGSHFLQVYGRLKPGVSIDQARADMDRIGAQLSEQYPDTNRTHGVHVMSMREYLQAPVRASVWILVGAVGFVLLIACVNVSNMLLARAAARRREMAVRTAIGAGRARLAGQAITESLLLSAVGTVAGLGLAAIAIRVLPELIAAQEPLFGLERASLNLKTVAFAAAACVAAGLFFGVLPAWQAANEDPNGALKAGGRSMSGIRRRVRVVLVGTEIALASLLLVGAGVALRSFAQVLSQPAGIDTANRLTFEISLPNARYREPERVRATMTAIEERLRAIPGAGLVASATFLPLSGNDARRGINIEGREVREGDPPTRAHSRPVGADYFRAVGATIVRGRPFTRQDTDGAPLVAIINQTAADRYWPGADPIGARLRFNGTEEWREIVGIVADVKHWGLDRPVNPELYTPNAQSIERFSGFVVRTDGDPRNLVASARAAVKAVDPALPLARVRTFDEMAATSAAGRRSTMMLLGAFAMIALVLAAAGVYGVMAHLVAMRTSEIAIRMTLGATPRDVLRGTVREGLLVAAAGVLVGFAVSLALVGVLRNVAFGIQPLDPVTYAGVAVTLVASTVIACWVPARRAMKVDPAVAIRQA